MKTEKYHLYIAAFNQDSAKIALDEPYSKASRTHVLIYKQGKKPDGYKEIKDADIYMLPASDRKWLEETNLAIMKLFMIKHRAEAERARKNFLEDFERELATERRKLQEQERDSE